MANVKWIIPPNSCSYYKLLKVFSTERDWGHKGNMRTPLPFVIVFFSFFNLGQTGAIQLNGDYWCKYVPKICIYVRTQAKMTDLAVNIWGELPLLAYAVLPFPKDKPLLPHTVSLSNWQWLFIRDCCLGISVTCSLCPIALPWGLTQRFSRASLSVVVCRPFMAFCALWVLLGEEGVWVLIQAVC